ncbi:succinoglycan biosynthesis transport protein ExoP [Mesorhizobium albiziae]|uniref:non-specific protein-tyrosine kinase n=1 Tax=Neomesorhizobium albiziae TaxID=335020 RepID=A0A1I3WBK9_9HYPH|nr:polysaccharide biosynthesis tyrosine autokinase [Mesorhizobium albiziae]GLS31515.1 chain-length determining protein [Mesorhizobium albiziae]SFK05054.1 succinoglycan biosynthesis transport protein ExoP [Mesorhizobium albiziae]
MNQRNLPLNGRLAIPSAGNGDPDGFIDLERLFQMAMRRARVVALCAAIGVALGVVYLMFAAPSYTSGTRILLDENLTKFAQEEAATAASNMKSDANLLTEVEILKSTRLALVVVDREKLDDNEAFMNPPQSPIGWFKSRLKAVVGLFDFWAPEVSEAAIKNGRRAKAASLLQQGLNVERVGRSFVIDVSFSSHVPQLAGSITRAYANAYLSDQLDANFDATQRATVWLQGRLTELRENSQAAALEVEQFRAANGLTAARGELISEQQLADLNSQLILAQADTASASARYTQYKSIVDSGAANAVKNATISSKEVGNSVIDALKTRYLGITKREQEISNRFGEDHEQAVSLRREQEDVARQIFQELTQLTESYRNEFEVAQSREASLRENIKKIAGQTSESSQALVQLRDLEQKASALKTLYETYLARYEEASQQRSFPIAKARVISEAGVPTSPSSPKKSMVLALSMVLGLMAGAGIGALQEFRERFFRLGEEVRDQLGLKFLGYLPIIGGSALEKARSQRREAVAAGDDEPAFKSIMRVAIDAPGSSFAETLRNARIAGDVVLQGKASKVIGIVSVLPHEGKSTVAANFAGLLAANGSKTLLIDGDLRNPGLSRMLSTEPEQGLVEAIMGEVPWPSAVKVDRKTRLAILPALVRGRISHTSELLSSPGMRKIIENAREKFDYIVVDLPPLAPVVDAKAFAHMADGFIFVTAWGATPRALVRAVIQAEPQIAGKVLGVVLNKTDMKQLGRYGSFGSSEQYIEKYAGYYVDKSAIAAKS